MSDQLRLYEVYFNVAPQTSCRQMWRPYLDPSIDIAQVFNDRGDQSQLRGLWASFARGQFCAMIESLWAKTVDPANCEQIIADVQDNVDQYHLTAYRADFYM